MEVLRTLRYKRHEFRHNPKTNEANLLIFVYDVPYFDACGIFPPFHIANQIFSSGGSDGGMSPGATWEPFTITIEEYNHLVVAVKNTPIAEISPYARFAHLAMKFDETFDHLTDRFEWMGEVCKKHRARFHEELKSKNEW